MEKIMFEICPYFVLKLKQYKNSNYLMVYVGMIYCLHRHCFLLYTVLSIIRLIDLSIMPYRRNLMSTRQEFFNSKQIYSS